MNREKISQVLGNMDPKYVEEAAAYGSKAENKHFKPWMKRGMIAACLALLVVAVSVILPLTQRQPETYSVSLGGIVREYKKMDVTEESAAIVWPWEARTVYEQYTLLYFNGEEYTGGGAAVSDSFLGESLGEYEVVGYEDLVDGKEHRRTFEVRQIQGISADFMVAVCMEGQGYVFRNDATVPPSELGDLLDGYSMANVLNLNRFALCEGLEEKAYYTLEDDGYIWQILSQCRSAPFVAEEAPWNMGETGTYLSFTATSEPLGVYKRAFYVREDGYISTNVFQSLYTYQIGEAAARQIMEYVKANAEESDFEPYMNFLAGVVTEIDQGYVLIEDTILCADPSDGMTFKIKTDDLRVSRFFELRSIKPGDVIAVQFTGEIDVEAGNVITGIYTLSKATIEGKDVWIVE